LEVQESLMHNEISERHARSLLSVKDEDKQIELLNRIKERKMTVRELDSEIKNMNENMNNLNEPRNDFMGQFPSGNPMPNVGVEKEVSTGFNPSDYFNNAAPTPPAPQAPAQDAGFMDFLNNYDNNNPVPSEPVNPSPAATQANEPADNGFMDFLNNYDNNNPVPSEPVGLKEQAPTATPEGNDFRNMLNSYENPAPAPQAPAQDAGFMDFLNNYDNNNPLPAEPASPAPEAAPASEPADAGFMSFLNNYDNNNPLPAEPAPANEPADAGFMSYLNNYDNNNPVPAEPEKPAQDTFSYDVPQKEAGLYDNFNSTANNVTPPTTNVNNQYVENNANFVDVSKQNKITNVDEIINKVGAVVKEIKEKSVFKIDTEEINYDDLYQITIKIDKRDF